MAYDVTSTIRARLLRQQQVRWKSQKSTRKKRFLLLSYLTNFALFYTIWKLMLSSFQWGMAWLHWSNISLRKMYSKWGPNQVPSRFKFRALWPDGWPLTLLGCNLLVTWRDVISQFWTPIFFKSILPLYFIFSLVEIVVSYELVVFRLLEWLKILKHFLLSPLQEHSFKVLAQHTASY